MAFTLGFHIILASLGVALPALMLIANYRGLRHDDPAALTLARRWSKAVAVTFAVGAVTGTVLSFEFGLLWPAFTGRFGQVFGILFAIVRPAPQTLGAIGLGILLQGAVLLVFDTFAHHRALHYVEWLIALPPAADGR